MSETAGAFPLSVLVPTYDYYKCEGRNEINQGSSALWRTLRVAPIGAPIQVFQFRTCRS